MIDIQYGMNNNFVYRVTYNDNLETCPLCKYHTSLPVRDKFILQEFKEVYGESYHNVRECFCCTAIFCILQKDAPSYQKRVDTNEDRVDIHSCFNKQKEKISGIFYAMVERNGHPLTVISFRESELENITDNYIFQGMNTIGLMPRLKQIS